MSSDKVAETLKKLESIRKVVTRLEKIVDEVNDAIGDLPFLEQLEEEIQEETPFAEKGHVAITGSGTDFSWTFEHITDAWFDVYSDDEDGPQRMQEMADQFRRLAEMFEEKATQIKEMQQEMEQANANGPWLTRKNKHEEKAGL